MGLDFLVERSNMRGVQIFAPEYAVTCEEIASSRTVVLTGQATSM